MQWASLMDGFSDIFVFIIHNLLKRDATSDQY